MNLMQPSLLQATNDRRPPHSEFEQLPTLNDAMLPPRQPLHLPLEKSSGQLNANTVSNRPLVAHGAER
jgi:hypothetical protein